MRLCKRFGVFGLIAQMAGETNLCAPGKFLRCAATSDLVYGDQEGIFPLNSISVIPLDS